MAADGYEAYLVKVETGQVGVSGEAPVDGQTAQLGAVLAVKVEEL